MINLLPPKQLATLSSEYRRRRRLIIGGFVLAWLLMAAIIIFSFNVLVVVKRQVIEDQLAQEKQDLTKTEAGLDSVQISKLAADVKLLNSSNAGRVLPTVLIQKVLALKSAGIKIYRLSFDGSAIQLSGVASTRRSLLGFVGNLRTDKTFAAVDSPVSNLIKDSDIEFNLKLTLAK